MVGVMCCAFEENLDSWVMARGCPVLAGFDLTDLLDSTSWFTLLFRLIVY